VLSTILSGRNCLCETPEFLFRPCHSCYKRSGHESLSPQQPLQERDASLAALAHNDANEPLHIAAALPLTPVFASPAVSIQVILLIIVMAIFAVLLDMLEIITEHPGLSGLLKILEEGGEMLVMSVITGFVYRLGFRG
jgi:hypothetical protein